MRFTQSVLKLDKTRRWLKLVRISYAQSYFHAICYARISDPKIYPENVFLVVLITLKLPN